MHPIEHLRYVARAGELDQAVLVGETADALMSLGFDPAGLLTSCRRIVARHPTAGALWTLAARMLTANDPRKEAWSTVDAVRHDQTAAHLVRALPEEASVLVIGWPDVTVDALLRRGDCEIWVVDAYGEGSGLVRHLDRRDVGCVEVPLSGLGAAAAAAGVAVIEASAAGGMFALCPSGSRAVAAVARSAGVPVWLVAGEGRVLPPMLWGALCECLDEGEPWERDDEVVPLDLVDRVVGPDGVHDAAETASRADCPAAAELRRLAVGV